MGSWSINPPNIIRIISQNQLLNEEELKKYSNKSIVVLSIFGPSQFTSAERNSGFKKAFQIAIDAFGNIALAKSKDNHSENKSYTTISGFYNEEESLVILCLDGGFDPNVCIKAFEVEATAGKNFMPLWSELKSSYSQALFLLFSISHVLILSNIAPYFDTSYIMLFRALENFRNDIYHNVRDTLSSIPGLPEGWVEHGRLCSPRLLFTFPIENPPNLDEVQKSDRLKKIKTKLENEIYQIFRKCRIITNVSGQSLLALPVDQESDFVFLYDEEMDQEQQPNWAQYVQNFCAMSNERVAAGLSSRPIQPKIESNHKNYVAKFRSFLNPHIKLALGKGFDDNAHKVSDRKHFFFLPKLGEWLDVFQKFIKILAIDQSVDQTHNKVLQNLSHYLDIDGDYLESQCSKSFHRVFSIYTKNIPSHYSGEEHEKRVHQAVDAFLCVSRAPGIVPWLVKLTEKCERYWKRGRQQCETRSLHYHLCINPMHRIEPDDNLEVLPHVIRDESLPEMKHCTGNRLTSYCNCGRRSGTRDEPFTIREANYSFYERIGIDCCENSDSWKVPVCQERKDEKGKRKLTLEEMLWILLEKKKEPLPQLTAEAVASSPSESQALERDLRQDEDEEEEQGDLEFQEDRDDFEHPVDDNPEGGDDENSETEQVQTISDETASTLAQLSLVEKEGGVVNDQEFLPGMLHSRCPPGLLPLFPSWSLLKFGISSAYAHTAGILHQPGFLAGSGYLLPWDVLVKAEEGVSKPVPRTIRGRVPSKRVQRIQHEFNVKVFIGFEYECRKGHRFMLESTDRVLQLAAPNFGPSIREAATKVASSDMPLYFKCPCNTQVSIEQSKAQLMKVHIVTPKAPVHVQLNPRVQPGHGGPYFTPGNTEPIKLTPSVYWILRLPYAYVSEDQIYTPPSDIGGYNGRICKGLFSVVSMSHAETVHWEANNLNPS